MASPHALVLSRLTRAAPTPIALSPDAAERTALAAEFDLSDLRKLRLEGRLIPEGRHDWRLEAHLGATVVQPCAVTRVPVTTRIEEDIIRRYLSDLPQVTAEEAEMPGDDSIEPLPQNLDLGAVLAETLALAVPPFPRATGAELGAIRAAPPGVRPLDDENSKPLAGLAALKDRIVPKDDGGDDGD